MLDEVHGERQIMLILTARLVGLVGAILALAAAFFMLLAPGVGPSPRISVTNALCALLR